MRPAVPATARGAIVTKPGYRMQVTVDGKMTESEIEIPMLHWAKKPWHMIEESVQKTCAHLLESCREMGLLLGKGGLYGQTIRFSPPMCLHQQDADFLLNVLDRAFSSV